MGTNHLRTVFQILKVQEKERRKKDMSWTIEQRACPILNDISAVNLDVNIRGCDWQHLSDHLRAYSGRHMNDVYKEEY